LSWLEVQSATVVAAGGCWHDDALPNSRLRRHPSVSR